MRISLALEQKKLSVLSGKGLKLRAGFHKYLKKREDYLTKPMQNDYEPLHNF